MNDGKHADLTRKIIGAFYKAYNKLGYGFSEKVYENSLAIELKKLELALPLYAGDQTAQVKIHQLLQSHYVKKYSKTS